MLVEWLIIYEGSKQKVKVPINPGENPYEVLAIYFKTHDIKPADRTWKKDLSKRQIIDLWMAAAGQRVVNQAFKVGNRICIRD